MVLTKSARKLRASKCAANARRMRGECAANELRMNCAFYRDLGRMGKCGSHSVLPTSGTAACGSFQARSDRFRQYQPED